MTKKYVIFFLPLIIAILACGSTTPLSTSEPVSSPQETSAAPEPSTPENPVQPTEDSELDKEYVTEPDISVPGLRVVYIREGHLWSWTDAGGSYQMTNSGDMITVCISNDGKLLAFMRGAEIWTMKIDGAEENLIDTQVGPYGRLWFAPNNSLLAFSTTTQIDVYDLDLGTKRTVTTYPSVPGGFTPEVLWMPDSSGFKTIVPAPTDGGLAELLYIFPDGIVASLAKFEMLSLAESPPLFSPDGGYVIYVAKLDNGEDSLFLMDSSGATHPYGDASQHVIPLGWFPDSKRFAYSVGFPGRTSIGQVSGSPVSSEVQFFSQMRWIDETHYLLLREGCLEIGDLKGNSIFLDKDVTAFDFILVN